MPKNKSSTTKQNPPMPRAHAAWPHTTQFAKTHQRKPMGNEPRAFRPKWRYLAVVALAMLGVAGL